jgi:hypothetical protein
MNNQIRCFTVGVRLAPSFCPVGRLLSMVQFVHLWPRKQAATDGLRVLAHLLPALALMYR